MLEVRDPIHGAIRLTAAETAVVDDPFVQRLRNVRALGFSALPFPGATHSRYAHSLGAMHLAGLAFDSAYAAWQFEQPGARERLRSAVRLGALLHDVGHPPFSHGSEFAMPNVRELGVGFLGEEGQQARRATHEDYTVAILEHGSIRKAIGGAFPFDARHVAGLISLDVGDCGDVFVDGGVDHRVLLSQIISSELDVDRLDYLVRDSYYSGARYGQIDAPWLLSNLTVHVADGRASLALDSRAVWAFDDFLVARHHMFLMVYFHHTAVVYEEMYRRFLQEGRRTFVLPADVAAYRRWDDLTMELALRDADDAWAQRIVERRPFKRVMERHGTESQVDLRGDEKRLRDAGIDVIHAQSVGKLSRYSGIQRPDAPRIYVVARLPGMPVEEVRPLAEATAIFERYAEAHRIGRLYVAPEEVGKARGVLGLPVG